MEISPLGDNPCVSLFALYSQEGLNTNEYPPEMTSICITALPCDNNRSNCEEVGVLYDIKKLLNSFGNEMHGSMGMNMTKPEFVRHNRVEVKNCLAGMHN